MATKRTYLSSSMAERRGRILREARELLASGQEELTIARLCDRASVAPRTVYRAFGDRDGVIQAAIVEHMESISTFLGKAPAGSDIDAIFREYDWIAAELFRGPAFAKVIVDFYFSQNQRPSMLESMQSVARSRIERWLVHAMGAGLLRDGIDHELLILHQIDGEYVVFHNWAAGLIADGQVADAMKANFVMNAVAACIATEQERLHARLAELHVRLSPRRLASVA